MTAPRTSPRSQPRLGRVAFGLLATLALLTACSSPVPGIQLALGDSSVAVLRGGTVDVDVVLTRTGGASGAVGLSVSGLPTGVTASFAPPTLDGGATNSVLTLSATGAAAEAAATLTVVATGASLTAQATLALEVESLGVAGRLESLFGIALPGITVASQGATTFTDADGAFELDGLSVPYDLAVSAALGSGALHVFEGLTTAAPVLRPVFALAAASPTALTATVSGDVLGGAAVAVDRTVLVCAEGLDRTVVGCDSVSAAGTSYSLNVDWYGPASTSVRLHALHVETAADDTPAAYLGYETFDLVLNDGAAYMRDLALSAVATVLVEGTIEAAAGSTLSGAIGGVRFGPRLTMQLFASTAAVGDVSVLMPAPAGATYDVTAIADGPSGASFAWAVDRGTDLGVLTAPAPLTQVAPAVAAVGVGLATPFSSSGSDEVRTYYFEGAGPTLAITTNRASVTVPNPAVGGFAFPAGAAYTWYVFGHGTMDADAALARSLLDYYRLLLAIGSGGPGFEQSGSFSLGTPRTFTFAP